MGDKFSLEGLSKLEASDYMFYNCSATLCCSPAAYWASKNCRRVTDAGQAVKPYVSINKTPEYGTLCVPVGSSLVAGSFTGFDKLYQVTNADKNKGTITLAEAKSIEPGVPYVYHRYLEGVDFDGKNDMSVITFDVEENASAAVTAPKNEGSLLKGTFESMVAKGGSYILQTDGNFHPVAADNTTLKVGLIVLISISALLKSVEAMKDSAKPRLTAWYSRMVRLRASTALTAMALTRAFTTKPTCNLRFTST